MLGNDGCQVGPSLGQLHLIFAVGHLPEFVPLGQFDSTAGRKRYLWIFECINQAHYDCLWNIYWILKIYFPKITSALSRRDICAKPLNVNTACLVQSWIKMNIDQGLLSAPRKLNFIDIRKFPIFWFPNLFCATPVRNLVCVEIGFQTFQNCIIVATFCYYCICAMLIDGWSASFVKSWIQLNIKFSFQNEFWQLEIQEKYIFNILSCLFTDLFFTWMWEMYSASEFGKFSSQARSNKRAKLLLRIFWIVDLFIILGATE
jgi:disulfide oxidoreductase YuzD